jgi:hypothetical protein
VVTSNVPGMNECDDITRIDCDSCLVRGPAACGDCVVTVLLGGPPSGVHLHPEERQALDALAAGGLVPPLRMVSAVDSPAEPQCCPQHTPPRLLGRSAAG